MPLSISDYLTTYAPSLAELCDMERVIAQDTPELDTMASQRGCKVGKNALGYRTYPVPLLHKHFKLPMRLTA